MGDRYSSGYLSKLFGVSITCIHTWEKRGIIPESQRDKVNNRRFWTKEQVEEAKKRTGRV